MCIRDRYRLYWAGRNETDRHRGSEYYDGQYRPEREYEKNLKEATMKKIISLALAVTMAVSLTACGGNSNSAGGQEPKVEEGSGQRADSQGAETIAKQTIKITHPQPEGTPEAVSYTHLDVYKRQFLSF